MINLTIIVIIIIIIIVIIIIITIIVVIVVVIVIVIIIIIIIIIIFIITRDKHCRVHTRLQLCNKKLPLKTTYFTNNNKNHKFLYFVILKYGCY